MTTRIAHDGDGLPAATADPRQTPSPAARLAQARQKIGAPFWPAAHCFERMNPKGRSKEVLCAAGQKGSCRKVHPSFAALARGAPQATGSAEDRQ